MKASWSGYLSLGNLNVPVQLYSAVKSSGPNFVQLHAKDGSPVGRRTVCLKEEVEIPASEIVRAVKHGDRYVQLTESEIGGDAAADKIMAVKQFSDQSDIKSKYYDKPYYIVPAAGGETAYTLLRQAFVKSNKVAIVQYEYYQREHIGLIVVDNGMMMLQQLRFATDLVQRSEIRTAPLPQPIPAQVDLTVNLMQRYCTPFYLEDYRHQEQDRINELVERKAKGLASKKPKKIAPKATKASAVVPAIRELLESAAPSDLPRANKT